AGALRRLRRGRGDAQLVLRVQRQPLRVTHDAVRDADAVLGALHPALLQRRRRLLELQRLLRRRILRRRRRRRLLRRTLTPSASPRPAPTRNPRLPPRPNNLDVNNVGSRRQSWVSAMQVERRRWSDAGG